MSHTQLQVHSGEQGVSLTVFFFQKLDLGRRLVYAFMSHIVVVPDPREGSGMERMYFVDAKDIHEDNTNSGVGVSCYILFSCHIYYSEVTHKSQILASSHLESFV